jgi:hypothetical protein
MKNKYIRRGAGLFMIFICLVTVMSLFSTTIIEAVIAISILFAWLALLVAGVILLTD